MHIWNARKKISRRTLDIFVFDNVTTEDESEIWPLASKNPGSPDWVLVQSSGEAAKLAAGAYALLLLAQQLGVNSLLHPVPLGVELDPN